MEIVASGLAAIVFPLPWNIGVREFIFSGNTKLQSDQRIVDKSDRSDAEHIIHRIDVDNQLCMALKNTHQRHENQIVAFLMYRMRYNVSSK
jgi:hypothetical protein